MKRIAVFDFDGTITRKDTLIEFIRFTKGTLALCWGLLLHLPLLVAMKMHMYGNSKTKEKVFSYFFKGTSIEQFDEWGKQFYAAQADKILYKQAIEAMTRHQQQDYVVIILSASVENWVRPFASALQAEVLLSTQAEVRDGVLTGKFATPNCYGEEKVNRLRRWLSEKSISESYIIAYGDSRGDKELLEFANEKHYIPFKR